MAEPSRVDGVKVCIGKTDADDQQRPFLRMLYANFLRGEPTYLTGCARISMITGGLARMAVSQAPGR